VGADRVLEPDHVREPPQPPGCCGGGHPGSDAVEQDRSCLPFVGGGVDCPQDRNREGDLGWLAPLAHDRQQLVAAVVVQVGDVGAARNRVLLALTDAGVRGAVEFGRFVSNTQHFRPSDFDERAAMPVLLRLLPSLTDRKVVGAVAGHLRRSWARPAAFEALLAAYQRWGTEDETGAGWHLADALVAASELGHLDDLLALAAAGRYGKSRQMLVNSLWRFGSDARVSPVLAVLCADRTVAVQAMSAYRRTVGNEAALPLLRGLLVHDDALVRQQAARHVRKAETAGRVRE